MLRIIFSICLLCEISFAKDFIREYNYNAGDNDSRNSARAIALAQVKKLLIEEIGVYMNSTFNIEKVNIDGKWKKQSKKTIESITAGITKTEILDEKFDGSVFSITAKISVDLNTFNKKLKQILNKKDIVEQLKKTTDEKNKILEEKNKLQLSLKEEKIKLALLKKDFERVKQDELLKLKTELQIKQSEIKTLNDNISYEKNSKKLQLNELVQKGNESYFSENYHQALSYYMSAEYLGYEDIYLKFNIGNIYYKLNNYNNAISNYKLYLNIYKNSIEANNNIAICYGKLKDSKNAILYYNKVIKLDPQNSYTYNNLGILYYNIDDMKKAIYYFKKSASLGNKKALNNINIIRRK